MSLVCLLSACNGYNAQSSVPPQERVNVFGTNANHPHSLLVFPGKVILLATHYGLFRSEDDGATWRVVAAGPGQIMDGLMTYSMVSSPLDSQRIYVLSQPTDKASKGTPGLYMSTDQGATWHMSIAAESITANNIFLVAAGNSSADEVYIYLNNLGNLGLKVSTDGGQSFTQTAPLPFPMITSLLAVPGLPGTLLAGGPNGLARSTDGAAHWQKIPGISGSIYELTATGPGSPIYASGDSGIFVSKDGGKTFSLVFSKYTLNSLTAAPGNPRILYGRTGTAIFRSRDEGHTWDKLPALKGNYFNLTADPANPEQVYLSESYPTAVFHFDHVSNSWKSLTPKPE